MFECLVVCSFVFVFHTSPFFRLSQVCEQWRQIIITTPILWKHLDLSTFADTKFPLSVFINLNHQNNLFSCVKHLNLSGWMSANAERIVDMILETANKDLESINFKYCRNISSPFLTMITQKCPNISSLDISAVTVS